MNVIKPCLLAIGLLAPIGAQAAPYIYEFNSDNSGQLPFSETLTRDGVYQPYVPFLKGTSFDLQFRHSYGDLSSDQSTYLPSLIEEDTRISFRYKERTGVGFPLDVFAYPTKTESGFMGFDDAIHRIYKNGFDVFYGFNQFGCVGDAALNTFPRLVTFESFLYGYGPRPGSTTYHITVSPVPLPLALVTLLGGLVGFSAWGRASSRARALFSRA